MDITKFAVKNYQFTFVIVLMVLALGVSSVLTMPRAEDPDLKTPEFPIVVVYPGTSMKDMEQLVVKPMESRIYALDNIKKVKTSIYSGLAVLQVQYKYGNNPDDKYQELVREVSAMRQDLPKDIYSIDIQKVEPSNVNILQVALISENASKAKMKKAADDLKDALEKLPALKNVVINGAQKRLVRVDVNTGQLAKMNISLEQIMQAIQSETANIPAGSIIAGAKSFSVKTSGNYENIDQIKKTIISSSGGNNVLLQDVAEVYHDYAAENHITRFDGYRCLFINAAQKEGENISKTQDAYLKVIGEFKKQLPANIDLNLHFDQADNVNKRLSGLAMDFMIAILLVSITLLPLGGRASLIVMIAIPLSVSVGLIMVKMLGYSLNQLSIVGFVVALGLLVDDSIVVVENIERWMREGASRMEAALKGTRQITLAILGCTATLIIAFLPLVYMPNEGGQFVRSMPLAVIFTVLGSLLVALTVVPFLATKLLKPDAHPEGNVVLRAFQRVIHGTYSVLLDRALKKPWTTVFIALCIFAASLALIPVVGFNLFPSSEKPQFMVNIQTAPQSSIYTTDSITRLVESRLRAVPEVNHFSSNVGKGNARIYYNVIQQAERSDFADIFVQLDNEVKFGGKVDIMEQLRDKLATIGGAKIEVKDFEQGLPVIAPVEVRLMGENLDSLKALSVGIEQMLKQVDGTIYVSNPIRDNVTDFKIYVNRDKALAMGIPTVNIDRAVRMAVSGLEVGAFSDPQSVNDDYVISLSVPRASYADLSVFDQLYVNNIQGLAVPLKQVASIGLESSPNSINHLNKVRTVSVNAFIKKGYAINDILDEITAKMDKKKLPSGYSYEMGGEAESRAEIFGGFENIIIVALLMFIAVLILEFRTFKSTLIVLSVIPLGIVGAILALLITGEPLSFVAVVGVVALAGIEVKNTILLVDFTNQLRREGVELDEAIEKAGELRFLPIILTTLTAIGGLLPIAWSSNPLISPLAIVMIGGLISSTLLSRVVTPVVYKLMPPKIVD